MLNQSLVNSVKVSQASHMEVWLSNHLKDGETFQKMTLSLENSAYLGQFLGIGQIVHSDGQEYVQQCVCGYGLRVGRQAKEKALASLRGSLQNFSAWTLEIVA